MQLITQLKKGNHMTKLLSALVAAVFAVASLTPAFAQEKKGEEKAMEKKDGKKKSDEKKKAEEKK
jgi:ribosomal protein L12E/L44/L45/RPP1/RPP2